MDERAIPPLEREAWASRRREALVEQLAPAGPPPVEAIVFDAYGTLFDFSAVVAACTVLTPHGDAFVRLWRAKQLEYTWLRTLMGAYENFDVVTAEALDYGLRHYDLAPDAALRHELLAAWTRLAPFPDVPETLARLGDWPLAILSNGNAALLEPLLHHSGLAAHFHHVLSAEAVAAYKPDHRVYALAPAALDRDVTSLLFVTANSFDALGAKGYGYQVAWCNRAGATLDTHGAPPDLELRALDQLPAALGG